MSTASLLEESIGWWESETWAERVDEALLGLMERKVAALTKQIDSAHLLKKSDWKWIDQIGAYFPPGDRIYDPTGFDLVNDGWPRNAALSFYYDESITDEDSTPCYLKLAWLRRRKRFPANVRPLRSGGVPYQVIVSMPQRAGRTYAMADWVAAYSDGTLGLTRTRITDFIGRYGTPRTRWGQTPGRGPGMASLIASGWADRRYLWLVRIADGPYAATFGVHEAQIQSLLYARTNPRGPSGKKRPILHWVQAHQRRLASGTTVDIKQHLRGVTEFTMDGLQYRIDQPVKPVDAIPEGDLARLSQRI